MVAGGSGALRRDVGVQVDHALRRWLIGTVKAGYGFDHYISDPCTCTNGDSRHDRPVSLGTALTYKFNRDSRSRASTATTSCAPTQPARITTPTPS